MEYGDAGEKGIGMMEYGDDGEKGMEHGINTKWNKPGRGFVRAVLSVTNNSASSGALGTILAGLLSQSCMKLVIE